MSQSKERKENIYNFTMLDNNMERQLHLDMLLYHARTAVKMLTDDYKNGQED